MEGVQDQASRWRSFIERLLTHWHVGGPRTTARVALGTVPDGWETSVVIPDSWHLVGSAARGYLDGRVARVDVVIDADGSGGELLEGYASLLAQRGWMAYEEPQLEPGGFSASISGGRRSFRNDDIVMHVTAFERPGEPVDVRLLIDTEHVRRMARVPHGIPVAAQMAPKLELPEGVVSRGSSGGAGLDHWYQHTQVDTELDAADLEAHCASQLAALGWTRLANRADDLMAWSSWQLPDNDWQGVLLALKALPGRRVALEILVQGPELQDLS